MNTLLLYTIGHSNRSIDDFVAILANWQIRTLVDIRSRPASDRFPHFCMEPLRESLTSQGLIYHWAGKQMGGNRKPTKVSRHTAIEDASLRAFADHMDTDAFKISARQLLNLAAKAPLAIMCAEKNPQHCHRMLISDFLVLQGVEIEHLIGMQESFTHELSGAARRESAELIYDRHTD